ncbi:MAG: hypothetical protein RIT04_463 [Candidatus Parcubacteria bacterium]|jgi:signal transduction histidine kinase
MEWLATTISSGRTAIRFIQKRIAVLLQPISKDEDARRQELILNVILLTSIVFLAILDGTIIYNLATFEIPYDGVSLIPFTGILVLFSSLFILSKKGYSRIASYVLIGLYMLGTIYCGYRWGASLPATLLTTTLVIVASSILIGTRCGMIISIIMICILSLLGIHEYQILGPQPWKYLPISTTDIITYASIFLFITMLSWLSNKEIERSLHRAQKSEKELKKERDNLEITVALRTESLRQLQLEQMQYLSRSAEFGKLAQGLFHDLMTPLTSIGLGVNTLEQQVGQKELAELKQSINKTIEASRKMGSFMESVRKIMKHEQVSGPCNTAETLARLEKILGYKLRNAGVAIEVVQAEEINHDPLSIERILLNLISNSIDAYSGIIQNTNKVITISIIKKMNNAVIEITDRGSGIQAENIQRIFEPFFTTKSAEHGSGIGLATVKTLVTELGGTISVESKPNIGTKMSITLPN